MATPPFAYHWIVAVNGKPTDIRGTSELATRQGKVRKSRDTTAEVTIHYGLATARTYHDGKGLVCDVVAELSPQTLLATILA